MSPIVSYGGNQYNGMPPLATPDVPPSFTAPTPANAVIVTPTGTIGSTDLQAALTEIDGDVVSAKGLAQSAQTLAITPTTLLDAITQKLPNSWWMFSEQTGTNIADSGSAGIAGTYVGALAIKGGSPGAAAGGYCFGYWDTQTAPPDTAMATFGNNYGFINRAPFTIMVFWRPQTFSTNFRRLLIKNDSAGGPFLGITSGGLPQASRPPSGAFAVSPKMVIPGMWQMLVYSYDGNTVNLFHNGSTASIADTTNMPTNSAVLRINGEITNAVGFGAGGLYSNLCIWNRCLDPVEINDIWKVFSR